MINVKDLHKYFGSLEVLKGINCHIEKGECVCIIGASGSGKSTFLRCLNLLETPTKGDINIDGINIMEKGCDVDELRRKVGMVFQHFNLFPHLSILDNVTLAPVRHKMMTQDEAKKKAMELLNRVGVGDKADNYPVQLSGGQKQRVGIARALTTDPELLLCDEATSALDPQTTESILKLLKKINRKMGVTILLITHQMQVVQMICNKVAVMESGKIVESGSVLEVFGSPKMPVTKRFVQTVIRDQIPDSIISLVKEQKENFRVDRLKFIGSSVKRPVISDICKTKGVVVNILGAAVQELEDSVMCVFILQLIGDDESIDKAEAEIDKNGVLRERLEVE